MKNYLTTLHLKNFRNFSDATVEWSPQFNFIFGKNAQGKTNLIEAIYFLSVLKSFRSTTAEVIKNKTDSALITSTLKHDEVSHAVRLELHSHSRLLTVDEKKPKNLADYFQKIPVILFEPADVYLLRNSPSDRRRFLDRALFLDNALNLKLQKEYAEVVLQKNKLLKEMRLGTYQPKDQLLVWNERQALLGSVLIEKRLVLLDELSELVRVEYQSTVKNAPSSQLCYQSPLVEQWNQAGRQPGELVEIFRSQLNRVYEDELRRGEAILGPHRDDFVYELGGRNLGSQGSQGENRTAVISLKSAQIELYRKKEDKVPLFLLDDVASELDLGRQSDLYKKMFESNGQIFLTTTEPSPLLKEFGAKARSFFVEDGRVEC